MTEFILAITKFYPRKTDGFASQDKWPCALLKFAELLNLACSRAEQARGRFVPEGKTERI